MSSCIGVQLTHVNELFGSSTGGESMKHSTQKVKDERLDNFDNFDIAMVAAVRHVEVN